MRKCLAILLATVTTTAFAADNPRWLRNTAISPDAKTIAFTYNGDIFTVPVTGGIARQLTSHQAYDTTPHWSPDGQSIVFASDREGSMDVYIVGAEGGTPRRLTTHSANEYPVAFINDTTILYRANILPTPKAAQPGKMAQMYTIDIKGGRPRTYASVPMGAVSVDAQGRLLYQDTKGYEDPLRKHEHSAGTSDIWLIADGEYTQLTNNDVHDLNPVWGPDNDTYYYITDTYNTLNIWSADLNGNRRQLTTHQRHPVRHLSIANDGTMAYNVMGEIYTLIPGWQPVKVDVKILVDGYDNDLVKGYRTSGASNMAVSPGGEEVAFVLRGDVYTTSTKYKTTRRITDTDGQERSISFSPDGKKLVYDSERDGIWQLFISEIADKDGKQMTYARDITSTPLFRGELPAQQPVFSPDGKKVAFLYGRDEIRVIDIESKAVNTALDGKYNYSYSDGDIAFEWSPDSRWLLTSYIGDGGWNNSDIALVKADGSEVVNLTQSGYSNDAPHWVLGGKGLTYTSSRYGYRSHGSWGEEQDVILMMLDAEAWDDFNLTAEEVELREEAEKAKNDDDKADDKNSGKDKGKGKDKKEKSDKSDVKELAFGLDNRHYRTRRLTPASSHLIDYRLSKKGDKLYYIAQSTEGDPTLYATDIKKGETTVLAEGIGVGGIDTDKDGEYLYLLTDQGMSRVDVSDGKTKSIDFEAPYSRHPSAERAYMFDHAARQIKDKFYDKNLHGVDWDAYTADYRELLDDIDNNYDFAELLSELLGELNASHTGARYYAPGAKMATASLGIFVDETYDGPGIKVAEVIARGPLSTRSANVQAGDIILAIDGDTIVPGADYYPMLEGKAGKKTRLIVKKTDGTVNTPTVRPIASVSPLLYQRWVERNEQIVDSLSGGRIGYVHVQGMDSESYREVYSKLLGKYRNCDAVVVDTRYNGGGWLHNDIAVLLSGKEYVRYSPRGKYIGHDPFSQWTKPSVMLVNSANYSDAHATPYTYRALDLGKIVGSPVPGTMTAVWWETMIDPSIVFGVPQVTSLDKTGRPLENQQLDPDIPVYNNPLDEQMGIDTQLAKAVETLMQSLK